MTKRRLRAGDIVLYEKKRHVVAGAKGWIHKHGYASIVSNMNQIAHLVKVSEVKLLIPRENFDFNWWNLFVDGEE